MHTVSFNQLATQTVSLFNDRLVPTLSPLQRKIALIVIGVFALIAACIIYARCLKPKINAQPAIEGNNGAAIAVFDQQKQWVEKMGAQMKESIEQKEIGQWLKDQDDQCKQENRPLPDCSLLCFVRMGFKEGNIKQQFIFKNKPAFTNGIERAPLSEKDCVNVVDAIEKSVKGDLKKDLGVCESFAWFILLKGDKGIEIDGSLIDTKQSTGFSSFSRTDLQEIIKISVESLGDMGIPDGTNFIQNGEFVPGQYYKDINA